MLDQEVPEVTSTDRIRGFGPTAHYLLKEAVEFLIIQAMEQTEDYWQIVLEHSHMEAEMERTEGILVGQIIVILVAGVAHPRALPIMEKMGITTMVVSHLPMVVMAEMDIMDLMEMEIREATLVAAVVEPVEIMALKMGETEVMVR